MIVLIPSYEPTIRLIDLISELKERTQHKIIIVDDGSSQMYAAIFEEVRRKGCKVLRHTTNKGKGRALKTGFAYIKEHYKDEPVICADSDGQHKVEDIERIASELDRQKASMVLGVRCFEGEVPIKSKVGNKVSSFLFKVTTGKNIQDTQTGLRGYPYKMLEWLCSVEGERFEYEFNLLLQARKCRMEIIQLPISTIYENNNEGTHFRAVTDSISVITPMIKFLAASVMAFVIDFILLLSIYALTGNLFGAVVGARIISSIFNYAINKRIVFKVKELSDFQTAPRYFGLVIIVMLLNYGCMYMGTAVLGISTVAAKFITEISLFCLSYLLQRTFVFKK